MPEGRDEAEVTNFYYTRSKTTARKRHLATSGKAADLLRVRAEQLVTEVTSRQRRYTV